MYDAIVVGARCGGAPTAMLLARAGHNVLMLDRSEYGSDIPHGHFIHRDGPRFLAEWNVLDTILATNCPVINAGTTDFGDFPLLSANLQVDGIPFGLAPRRDVLDQILVDAAVATGVEYRDNVVVETYLSDSDVVTGISARSRTSGGTFEEKATITIGADGRNSGLARSVGASTSEYIEPLTFWCFAYFADVSAMGFEIYARPNGTVFVFPTNDGQLAVFAAIPTRLLAEARVDFEQAFNHAVDQVPDLSNRLGSGKRTGPVRTMIDLPNFVRRASGPGWALVGDAGIHKDPFLALGICDAFRDAAGLATAVNAGLTESMSMDDALTTYETQRNQTSLPHFHENLQQARMEPPPPDVFAIRQAIRNCPGDARDFMLAFDHHIPAEQFFNPVNLQRIFSQAGMAPPGPPM